MRFEDAYNILVRLHPFFMGASFALSLIASLLFLRFYFKTSDRLFLFFCAAFALMSVNRIAFQFAGNPNEAQPALYVVRLFAFGLIIFGIVAKNMRRRIGRKNER